MKAIVLFLLVVAVSAVVATSEHVSQKPDNPQTTQEQRRSWHNNWMGP